MTLDGSTLKTFGHTKREGLLLATALHVGLALLSAVVMFFLWTFRAAGLEGGMTIGHGFVTVLLVPVVPSLILILSYRWASRYSVAVDRSQVIVCFDGEEIERRDIRNFLAFEQSTFGNRRNRITFQGEPDQLIKGLSGLKLHALNRYIQEITQRNERNRNEVRTESASPHAS